MNKFSLLFPVLSLFLSPIHAHQGFSSKAAGSACAEKELGNLCEWTDAHDSRYIGTCRKVSSLMCVRNKPIIYSDKNEHSTHEHDDTHEHKVTP